MRSRIRYMFLVTLILTAVSCGFGLYKKKDYADINEQENLWSRFRVAMLSERLLDMQLELMGETLDTSPIILAVKCQDSSYFDFHCITQRAEVLRVFCGQELQEGDLIQIVRGNSEIYLSKNENMKSELNMNFVNEMKIGKTYLVFLENKIANTECLYQTSIDYIIAPIFCYDTMENVYLEDTSEGIVMVNYDMVKDNEFFLKDKLSYDRMNLFKEKLFEKYVFIK